MFSQEYGLKKEVSPGPRDLEHGLKCVCVGRGWTLGRHISQTVTLMGRGRFKRGQEQGS